MINADDGDGADQQPSMLIEGARQKGVCGEV